MALTARTEFAAALNQLASEKGVDPATVVEAIEQAALAAFRKDLSLRGQEVPEDMEGYIAKVDPASGEIHIQKGDQNVTPPGFARIAAQTAKQVIMQRLNEAEKGAILEEYDKKIGTVMSGIIQRQEGSTYFIDLGRAEGVMPLSEQTRGEYYYPHQRLKFLIKEIRDGRRGGPEVVLSRTDPKLIEGLFSSEVPEVQTGSVVIKEIARESGSRTKIAVTSTQPGVDPVGSLVGQKGVRVQAVMNELGEERIDIVPYSEDLPRFVASALSPAKDVQVKIEEINGDKVAKVTVPEAQLSLAIGRGGQNARLAAKLTGCKVDIGGTGEGKEVVTEDPTPAPIVKTKKAKKNADEKEAKVEEKVEVAKTEDEGEKSAEAAVEAETETVKEDNKPAPDQNGTEPADESKDQEESK